MGAFARDFRRLNVAFSRAQELLVIVGARESLESAVVDLPKKEGSGSCPVQVYRRVIEIIDGQGGRRDASQLIAA